MTESPPFIRLFSTCPQSKTASPRDYLAQVERIAAWSEAAGCEGMLIYTDNSIVDPWLVAQAVLRCTSRLCPLVAVQPVYMLPYTAAKMVASLGFLYQRRIWLNMLAGGFRNDLLALGDTTAHDLRYARTSEYAQVMRLLLETDQPVNFTGDFYQFNGLRMTPPLPPDLRPGFMISGSSAASRTAAAEIGAVAVEYPAAPGQAPPDTAWPPDCERGARVGILARSDGDTAWREAHARFPTDRRGQLAHELAMKVSDSEWHHRLSRAAGDVPRDVVQEGVYWLHPFASHQTFCPYLVGDVDAVSSEIARYLSMGYTSFVLDIPRDEQDLWFAAAAFNAAVEKNRQVSEHPPDAARP